VSGTIKVLNAKGANVAAFTTECKSDKLIIRVGYRLSGQYSTRLITIKPELPSLTAALRCLVDEVGAFPELDFAMIEEPEGFWNARSLGARIDAVRICKLACQWHIVPMAEVSEWRWKPRMLWPPRKSREDRARIRAIYARANADTPSDDELGAVLAVSDAVLLAEYAGLVMESEGRLDRETWRRIQTAIHKRPDAKWVDRMYPSEQEPPAPLVSQAFKAEVILRDREARFDEESE